MLGYADDMVLMAKKEEELKSMMERLEEYLDGKRLESNARKTKIVRFRRRGGRTKVWNWSWKEKLIEEK